MNNDTLPSGDRFQFWDDATTYHRVYHVAQGNPTASDRNPGTEDSPFATISAAAAVLQGGEKVIVHKGIYREFVCPPRGGQGADRMIAYEAAAGDRVVVRGSDVWKPVARPSSGYRIAAPANGAKIWMADLPEASFRAYNPFLARNVYDCLPVFGDTNNPVFMRRALLRRGAIFVDGIPLRQVFSVRELTTADGAFWVEEPGLRVHFRLAGDAEPDPDRLTFEVTAREQVFAPREMGVGYIRVSGFVFEHAADGLPVPQRAAVSTTRGHHWIIENNRIEWANACGLDVGTQTWDAQLPSPTGRHIVRGNTIRRCGICGLAGARGVHHSLIESNTFEEIGGLDLERMWEAAGIKFHDAEHCLFRGNVIRHIRNAGGLWLDCSNVNNRVTGNTFADIESLNGAAFVEMTYDLNWVDNNVFWDIRDPEHKPDPSLNGAAIRADCNETLVAAHNFFGKVQGFAVLFSLNQSERKHDGRTGLCRANAAYGNVFYQCPNRMHLGRREENRSDGNLYDSSADGCSFHIAYPQPSCYQDLAGWQKYFGLDLHSAQAGIQACFDFNTCELTWKADGPLPATPAVPGLAAAQGPTPGPCKPTA